jgi:hypothetical protein
MYDIIASITAARPLPYPIAATSSSQPLPLHFEKFGQPSGIGAESVPGRAKLPHAVRTVLAGAVGLSLSHGDDVVDAPGPALKLNADRADLDLVAIANDDPTIVARRRMDHFAQEQVHAPMIPPIWPIVKPLQLGVVAAHAHAILPQLAADQSLAQAVNSVLIYNHTS